MASEFRRLTYGGNGEWGLKHGDLMELPPAVYGACAKLYDLEQLCEEVCRAGTREDAVYALQRLLDNGLGGRFVELEKLLEEKP